MAEIADVLTALKAVTNNILFPLTATVGGSATVGDVVTITATDARGNTRSFAYTVQGGDTLGTITAALSVAFTNAMPLLSNTSVAVNGDVLTFNINPGVWSLSGSVTGAGSETLTFGRAAQPIALSAITLVAGTPNAKDLDQMVDDSRAGTQRGFVAVYPRQNTYRNTSRYPSKWQQQAIALPTSSLNVSVVTDQVTLTGTAPSAIGTNFALVVGVGPQKLAFVYAVQPGDTLTSIAASMAALVAVQTPATSLGGVITIPAAWSIIARIGITANVMRELRRQCEIVDINIWVADPLLNGARQQIGDPIRQAIADSDWMILADQSAARVRPQGDFWLDDPEKVGLFRRCLAYEIEYPTTEVKPAAQIVVVEVSADRLGQRDLTLPTPVVFNY